MIYSRDNQISLCKKLHDMFTKIRDGTFDPDATRVSRLFQLAYATMLESNGDESSSNSSSTSDASSVASSEGEHNVVAQRPAYQRLETDEVELSLNATMDDLNATEAVICANCSHAYKASENQS
ncbi:unnamed protein product [Cladocopium goreaui]|uniref:Uncharacterized protein n=1 Tax=Cladocopium goreaui TaxID=2562237 RepID=A0A9P1DNZ6_9DINO|nr:unnamed protein product [Cladocopium goreaui]